MPGNIETPKINRNSKILEYLDAVIYNIINVFKKFENELENERLIIQATETKKKWLRRLQQHQTTVVNLKIGDL